MTGRIEQIGDATLHLGDCRDVLDGLQPIDAVITDPVWPNAPAGMFDVIDPKQLLKEALDKIHPKRGAIILRTDSDPRFLSAVPESWAFVRHQNLEYVATGYLGRVLGGMEIVYGFGEPIPSRAGQRVIPGSSSRVQPSGERTGHPCQRHPEHMKFVVRWWSEPGETVLDPFMGTSTIGAACLHLGRKFIGCEIDEKFFDIACRRLEEALKQPRLFKEDEAFMSQGEIFG